MTTQRLTTIQRKINGAVALGVVFFFASLLYGGGCAKKEPSSSDRAGVSTQNKEVTGDTKRSSDEDASRKKENSEKFSASESEKRENSAAEALGDATERFAQIFADGESSDAATGELKKSDDWDESLVDEETKRKYAADRTVVEPILAPRSAGDDESERPKYRLEYKFAPNSSLSWNVVHQVRKKTSYGGHTRTVETSSTTFRRWDFGELDADGSGKVAARHFIDRMILRQNEEEKEPVDYDSERDVVVPPEIAAFGTEKAVGVLLETFKIDPFGVMSAKKKLVQEYQGREGDSNVLVPFPKEPVGVGDVWTIPYALYLKGADGVVRPYRVVERFQLENVDEKRASICFKTTLTSIVDDPVVEGALAERLFSGRALFDRERGLTLRTELTFDKTVANAFGEPSFLEYYCQVVEKLVRDETDSEPTTQDERSSQVESAEE